VSIFPLFGYSRRPTHQATASPPTPEQVCRPDEQETLRCYNTLLLRAPLARSLKITRMPLGQGSSARNIADYTVDLVAALGSDTVFSLTGGLAMYLNYAVAAHPRLKAVYCQHEQACVAAAEGYSKASGFRRAGFAIVTGGPGVSNSVTSLISANGDSTPLIVLAGQIKTADIDTYSTRTHGIQEIRSKELIPPCVKRFVRLEVSGFRDTLVTALSDMFAGRPGVVFIEIPLDVQGVRIEYSEADIAADVLRVRNAAAPDTAGVEGLGNCLKTLLGAKRPLLYVGNGCRIAGVEAVVRDFITQYSIPAVFSWLSFDILPANHPLNFGCPGGLAPISANEILGRADTIVFLGARLDLGTTAFQRKDFGFQAARYWVDADPNELSKFKGFANGVCTQADLRVLPQAIGQVPPETGSNADSAWLEWCTEQRSSYLTDERNRLASEKMNVYGIARLLSRWSQNKVFVPASSGYAEETFTRFFEPTEGTRFFNGAALGSMGLGLPQAIGASFGTNQRVICMEADGGLMLNLQELATLSGYAPKGFVLFVLNNDGYESIRASQLRVFGITAGADRQSGVWVPDFARIAAAFDIPYLSIETLDALEALLSRLGPDDPPIMVNLRIERAEPRGPSVKTIIGDDGKPYSTPLAEISW
jgi:acetolactate synthase-1/2/3 large subunit